LHSSSGGSLFIIFFHLLRFSIIIFVLIF